MSIPGTTGLTAETASAKPTEAATEKADELKTAGLASKALSAKADTPYWMEVGKKGVNRLNLQCEILDPKTWELLETLGLSSESQVLDVGCGNASMARQVAKRYGCQVLGLDAEPKQLELAKTAAIADGVNGFTTFEQCLASEIRERYTEQFDVVMCRLFLCHLDHPERVLAQMIERVKPGGVLICEDLTHGFEREHYTCTPSSEGYEFWLDMAEHYGKIQATDFQIGQKLAAMAEERGLKVITNKPYQSQLTSPRLKAIFRLGMLELREKFIDSGKTTSDRMDRALEEFRELEEGDFTADYFPMIQVVARKPS